MIRKLRIAIWVLFCFLSFVFINWMVQAFIKPSEIVGVADGNFFKSPEETWKEYGTLFRQHATEVTPAEFLAALAQFESAGNPIARSKWGFHLSWNPFKIYRPISSSSGMYQITDGTYELAKHYCIHSGNVVQDGAWYQWNSCWFNFFYNRLVPSHAIEMTSAFLTARTLEMIGERETSLHQRHVAALIHFCGPKYAEIFVKSGFQVQASNRCGELLVEPSLKRMDELTALFASVAK